MVATRRSRLRRPDALQHGRNDGISGTDVLTGARWQPERMTDEQQKSNRDLAVEEARPKLKRPPLYRVVLLNDDYTPMEFVVEVLEKVFGMDRTKATRIMLEVHTRGKGVCGVYTYEIAETKVAQVNSYSRQHQHPLLCTMEES